jgi:hypothetical protein
MARLEAVPFPNVLDVEAVAAQADSRFLALVTIER